MKSSEIAVSTTQAGARREVIWGFAEGAREVIWDFAGGTREVIWG